ncbi:MAG: sulfatase [Polyangiaceae bacterium]|nr:sulfatase [Polyangiaceae bacterium]
MTRADGATEQRRRGASVAEAQLLAWIAAASIAVVAGLASPGKPKRAFIVSLAVDAGQHAAAGLVAAAAAAAYARWGSQLAKRLPTRARALGWLAPLALAAAVLSVWLVRPDLEGVAMKATFIPLGDAARITLVAALASLVVPGAALVGSITSFEARAASASWLGIGAPTLGAAVGFGAIGAHAWLLDENYPGLHLLGTITGVSLAGASLRGVPFIALGRVPRGAIVGALLGGALAATLLKPADRAIVLAVRRGTAVFAPFVARAHSSAAGASQIAQGEWFAPRDGLPPIAPSRPPLIGSPTLILLTVDALRPEILAKKHCKKLPNFCALAKQGVTFQDARSPAPATTPSLTSLFTGKYYSQLYWQDMTTPGGKERLFAHEDTSVRFPSLLTDAGVHTFNAASYKGYEERFGIVQGFEVAQYEGDAASKVVQRMVKNLDEARPGPVFMYAHVLEPHAPYEGKGKTPQQRWLGDVATVDASLGALMAGIEASPRAATTLLIVTSDHGEAFGEHGANFHGSTIYEEMIRVPMIIAGKSLEPRRVDVPVSVIDLGPTILDLFGVETPGAFMGQSLVPFLRGEEHEPTRPIVVDSSRGQTAMIFRDGYKVIYDGRLGTVELYDLGADPKEENDLAPDNPGLASERGGALRAFLEAHTLKRPGYEKPYRK